MAEKYEKGLLEELLDNNGLAKLKKKLIRIILIIVILNIGVFSIPIIKNSVNKPYARAKALTTAAATVNFIYIFPLSKVFGYRNILVLPFYPIRDYLYNTGISFYPKKDGERELMWFQVRYAEYSQLIHPLIQTMTIDRLTKIHSEEDMKMLLKWQDELTAHLEPFSTWKISDKSQRKYRFNQFLDFAIAAGLNRSMVVDHMLIKYSPLGQEYLAPIYRVPEEMAKIEKVLTCYQNLRKYEEKYEPEGISYLYDKTRNIYLEDSLKILIGTDLIGYKLIHNELKCDEPLVNMYGESYTDMLKIANMSRYYHNRFWQMGVLNGIGMQSMFTCYCVNSKSKYLKDFLNYYKNDLLGAKKGRLLIKNCTGVNLCIGYKRKITRNGNDLNIGY